MRRKDKEIIDRNVIDKILNEAQIIRIAMVDGTEPYIVAMNYFYMDGALYMHSAMEGRKIDILRKNNRVAFQTETAAELHTGEDACDYSMKYLSVSGMGRVSFIDDDQIKTAVLNGIINKHTGKSGYKFPEAMLGLTLIIKIEIDSISGKKSKY